MIEKKAHQSDGRSVNMMMQHLNNKSEVECAVIRESRHSVSGLKPEFKEEGPQVLTFIHLILDQKFFISFEGDKDGGG